MTTCLRFSDELGPAKIVHIYEPALQLKAVLVIDNTACGPALGGVRLSREGTTEEAFRLSRAMTLKNAAAGLPHGGGKAIIFCSPKLPHKKKEPLIRAFALAIRDIKEYIPGPDMGMKEEQMAWIYDEIGRGIGRPSELGGIPLNKIGATGFGLSVSAEVAAEYLDFTLKNARVVIQGFGAVGKNAALFLSEKGALIVAVSDSSQAIYDPGGLDVSRLIELKDRGGPLYRYRGGKKLPAHEIVALQCDIWIPAARPDAITAENAERLKAKLFLPGANIPITPEAEEILTKRGVLVLPDFITNAGGVICGAMEVQGLPQSMVFQSIEEKIGKNLKKILDVSEDRGVTPVKAALDIAKERVKNAMKFRRWR